jgi:hypothetical protein
MFKTPNWIVELVFRFVWGFIAILFQAAAVLKAPFKINARVKITLKAFKMKYESMRWCFCASSWCATEACSM